MRLWVPHPRLCDLFRRISRWGNFPVVQRLSCTHLLELAQSWRVCCVNWALPTLQWQRCQHRQARLKSGRPGKLQISTKKSEVHRNLRLLPWRKIKAADWCMVLFVNCLGPFSLLVWATWSRQGELAMTFGLFIGACPSICRWRCVPGLQLLLWDVTTTTTTIFSEFSGKCYNRSSPSQWQ